MEYIRVKELLGNSWRIVKDGNVIARINEKDYDSAIECKYKAELLTNLLNNYHKEVHVSKINK